MHNPRHNHRHIFFDRFGETPFDPRLQPWENTCDMERVHRLLFQKDSQTLPVLLLINERLPKLCFSFPVSIKDKSPDLSFTLSDKNPAPFTLLLFYKRPVILLRSDRPDPFCLT